MKKQTTLKKLRLAKHAVRVLDPDRLDQVAGGAPWPPVITWTCPRTVRCTVYDC